MNYPRWLVNIRWWPRRIKIKILARIRCSDIRNKHGYKPIIRHGGLGIVVGENVYIGKNVIINQNVTIGNKNGCPKIMDGVRIYPGCIIIGNITIGENSIIGAGTYVDKDIPPNSTVYNKKELIIKSTNEKTL